MARFLVLAAASTLLGAISYAQQQPPPAQDQQAQQPTPSPSLGEIARQLKWKKQQKDAQQKAEESAANQETQVSGTTAARPPAKSAHLVSHDGRRERADVTPVSTPPVSSDKADSQADGDNHQAKAETWKSEILAQKNAIATLEQDIQSLGDSIHFAGANCVANCAQWNERQQQKQREVDTMKAQLDEARKQLDGIEESARKQGFGSSLYEP